MTDALRILLVDDDDSNRLTLAAVLEDEGYTIAEASSFTEGEDHLRGAAFDVVLLDRRLGARDGATLAPLAKRHNPEALVCVLSGNVTEEALPAVDAQLCKGNPLDELLARIAATARAALSTQR